MELTEENRKEIQEDIAESKQYLEDLELLYKDSLAVSVKNMLFAHVDNFSKKQQAIEWNNIRETLNKLEILDKTKSYLE